MEMNKEENEFESSEEDEGLGYFGFDDEEECSEEDEGLGLVKLFGYENERYRYVYVSQSPQPAHDYDCDSDSDSDSMTEEEYRSYSDQVKKSEGFDVEDVPGRNMFGQIFPMDIDDETRVTDYDFCSQLAVDEYRRRFKDENGELEFVKVLKVMSQVVNGIRFYITFEAKDLAGGEKIKIYQAVVLRGVDGFSVSSFRLKPLEDEQGTGSRGRGWFWEDHLCHGHDSD